MLTISPASPVYVVHGHIDFRQGLEKLAAVCETALQIDPTNGCVFVFRNRKMNAVKVLFHDGTGFWLCTKRLSKGRFVHWPNGDQILSVYHARELLVLLWQGDPTSANFQRTWKLLPLQNKKDLV